MIFQQVVNFLHYNKKNNKTRHEEPAIVTEKLLTQTESIVEVKEKSQPQVEFEQSRFLLEMDFFHEPQERIVTSFPQFDHLLQQSNEQQHQDTNSLPRKLTSALRHRISIYKPTTNSRMKRSRSTPIFE